MKHSITSKSLISLINRAYKYEGKTRHLAAVRKNGVWTLSWYE